MFRDGWKRDMFSQINTNLRLVQFMTTEIYGRARVAEEARVARSKIPLTRMRTRLSFAISWEDAAKKNKR